MEDESEPVRMFAESVLVTVAVAVDVAVYDPRASVPDSWTVVVLVLLTELDESPVTWFPLAVEVLLSVAETVLVAFSF
jgi:hypothetical protein